MAWWVSIDHRAAREGNAVAASILLNREQIAKDRAALIERFGKDEWVAYFGGKLVDHDRDENKLVERLKSNYSVMQRMSMAFERISEEDNREGFKGETQSSLASLER